MSATTEAKLDPTEAQTISSEPKSAQHDADTTTHAKDTEEDKSKTTYTEMASSAATSAATTASTAAVGVKDNVFSMFGGGAKKEKKDETGEPEDRSGSSKAKKDAEAAEVEAEGEVRFGSVKRSNFVDLLIVCSVRREKMPQIHLKYTSSQWCISPTKSKSRPTRS